MIYNLDFFKRMINKSELKKDNHRFKMGEVVWGHW